MSGDITCDVLSLARVGWRDDITYDNLIYDDIKPECEIMGLI